MSVTTRNIFGWVWLAVSVGSFFAADDRAFAIGALIIAQIHFAVADLRTAQWERQP